MTHARYVCKRINDGRFRRDAFEAVAKELDCMQIGDVLRLKLDDGCPCYTWFKKRSMLNGYQLRQITAGDWKVAVRVK